MSKNSFFVYDDRRPEWIPGIPWSEQPDEVYSYFKLEKEKCLKGYRLSDEVFFHPWLYWHINFFPLYIDRKTDKVIGGIERVLGRPQLRDNELYINHFLLKAEKERKGLIIFGTRRFAKSVFISSFTQWNATFKYKSFNMVVGGSSEDLGSIQEYLETGFKEVDEWFKLDLLVKNWDKEVEVGRRFAHTKEVSSRIRILNLNKGSLSNELRTAGGTPTGFVMDEIGKYPMLNPFLTAKYSFSTPYGWRAIPILLGTGGNTEKAQDAKKILENTDLYNMVPMDWDLLNSWAGEYKTWVERPFGIFVPAQMSLEPGLHKLETNLFNFLDVDSYWGEKIKVYVTDWKNAKEILEKRRIELRKRDSKLYEKERANLPLEIDDIFVGDSNNPYPVKTASRHLRKIKESKPWRAVELYRMGGKVYYEDSLKEIATFPWSGGNIDAPVLLFEEPPEHPEVNGMYVAGLDYYKQDKSGTDSLGALIIFKREMVYDRWFGRVVASYVSRPNSMEIFNKNAEMLLEMFGAECLMEGADLGFDFYMRERDKDHIYLADANEMVRQQLNAKRSLNIKRGLPTSYRSYILGLVASYANKDIVLEEEEDGEIVEKTYKGVELINDPGILEEMIAYRKGGNFDRLIAFGHALAWAKWLDYINVYPDFNATKREKVQRKKTGVRSGRRVGYYSKRIVRNPYK